MCIISRPSTNSNWSYNPGTLKSGQNWQFFVPCDIKILGMTLKNNRTPLLCHFKLCASFHSHQSIQTRVTVRKHEIRVKIGDFFCAARLWNLTDDLEKIGHLFQPTSSFVHHFLAICELSYGPETPNSGQNRQFVVPCDVEIWRMTLQNNKAPLIFHIKLCLSFHWPMWIRTGVSVRKRLNCFLTSVTLTFCMDITSVNGNNSWKIHDDTVKGT